MSKRMHEVKEQVRDLVEALGVRDYEFGHCKGHQQVIFTYQGQRIRFTFPGTPSDGHKGKQALRTHFNIKVREATARAPVPGASQSGPVLDARRVLPRQSHDVGGRRARVREDKRAILYAGYSGNGAPTLADIYAQAARSLQHKV